MLADRSGLQPQFLPLCDSQAAKTDSWEPPEATGTNFDRQEYHSKWFFFRAT
jgi:hypothetical protein